MKKNSNAWSREELILALDFYFKYNPLHISANNILVRSLCDEINKMNDLRYQLGLTDQRIIRNPNAVYMKLCNYLRLDPSYAGKGLEKGSRLEKEVWDQYFVDKAYLAEVVCSIKSVETIKKGIRKPVDFARERNFDTEVREGTLLFTLHRSYERNSTVVKNKKNDAIQKHGKLKCEICGFCFSDFYGEIGEGFMECHHLVPLSQYGGKGTTSLDELILVCSNCHRMLHAKMGQMGAQQLRKQVILHGGHINASKTQSANVEDKK